jgi:hypothetical protein
VSGYGRWAGARSAAGTGRGRLLALIVAPRRKAPQMPKMALPAAPNAGNLTSGTGPPVFAKSGAENRPQPQDPRCKRQDPRRELLDWSAENRGTADTEFCGAPGIRIESHNSQREYFAEDSARAGTQRFASIDASGYDGAAFEPAFAAGMAEHASMQGVL